jgi:hypothetical protein
VIKEDKKYNAGRMLSCEIKIENQIYKWINIYCPNNNAERKQLILSIDIYFDIEERRVIYWTVILIVHYIKNIDRLPSQSYDKPGTKKLRDLIL